MLRRPLTTIRLTTEDVLDYDDRKQKENEQSASGNAVSQANTLNKPPRGPSIKKTKEQRIGISQ